MPGTVLVLGLPATGKINKPLLSKHTISSGSSCCKEKQTNKQTNKKRRKGAKSEFMLLYKTCVISASISEGKRAKGWVFKAQQVAILQSGALPASIPLFLNFIFGGCIRNYPCVLNSKCKH